MNAGSSRSDDGPPPHTLAQVTLEDAAAADRMFSMLMGDQSQSPQRLFIGT